MRTPARWAAALALACAAGPALAQGPALTPPETDAQQVVRRFLAAVGKKDADAALAEWDPAAPETERTGRTLRRLFAGAVEVSDPAFTFTRARDDTARVHVRVTVTAAGVANALTGDGERAAELARVNGAWKLRAFDDLAGYYERLFADRLTKPADRRYFFTLHPELLPKLADVLTRAAVARGELGRFSPGDAATALTLCDAAAALAEFTDSNLDRAWATLHRGVVLEHAGRFDAALKELDAARAGFDREEADEGKFVARLHRGRVLVRLDRPRDAAPEFEDAYRLQGLLIAEAQGYAFREVTWRHLVLLIQHQKALDRMRGHWGRGEHAEALKAAGEMNRLESRMYGPTHLTGVLTLTAMAQLAAEKGDLDTARGMIELAGTVVNRLYPPDHERAVTVRVTAGWVGKLAGLSAGERAEYWKASAAAEQATGPAAPKQLDAAAATLARLLGPDDPTAAEVLAREARALRRQGDLAAAVPLYERIDRAYVAAYGEKHPRVQNNLTSWGLVLGELGEKAAKAGDYAAARDHYAAAVKLAERGHRAVPTPDAAGGLAEFRWRHTSAARWAALPADRADARAALKRALALDLGGGADTPDREVPAEIVRLRATREVLRAALGDDHAWATVTLRLMLLSARVGKIDGADELQTELRQAMERQGLRAHPIYPMVLTPLQLTRDSGPAVRRAVAQFREVYGDLNPATLKALSALADWQALVGQREEAVATQTLVVRGFRRVLRGEGSDRPAEGGGPDKGLQQAYALAVAKLLRMAGPDALARDGVDAEAELKQWEAAARRANGAVSPERGMALAHLAAFYWERGEYQKALDTFDQVREVFLALGPKVAPGQQLIVMGKVAEFMGDVYFRWRDLGAAEKAYRQSLDFAKSLGTPDAEARGVLGKLLLVLTAAGKAADATGVGTRLIAADQRALDEALALGSEREAAQSLSGVGGALPGITGLIAAGPADPAAAERLWTWRLRLKGAALDAGCRFREAQAAAAADPGVADLAARLREAHQKLVDQTVRPPAGASAGQLTRDRERLREEQDRLTAELKRAVARARPDKLARDDAVTLAAVRAKLPPGTALVEYAAYYTTRYEKTATGATIHFEYKYLALVQPAKPGAAPVLVDLGPAAPIEEAVKGWRATLAAFRERYRAGRVRAKAEAEEEAKLNKYGRDLDRLLFDPLRPHLGADDALLVIPDGDLHLVPFAAFVGADGKYLAESRRVHYLSSGRDLLRPPAAPGDGVVVFAGPDFDLGPADRWQAVRAAKLAPAEPRAVRGPAAGATRQGWDALEGAGAEAGDVAAALTGGRFGAVRAHVGRDALEEQLKAVKSPRVLHLATHGFYYPPPQKPERATGVEARLQQAVNPLLRSGLVLAGANRWRDRPPPGADLEDGWVTAEEAALLDLRGTELVVLSACEAGLGDVRAGEGVYGLRRAFLYAGARAVVATLEVVPDAETRELMRGFYARVGAGAGRAAALGEAQREVLARRRKAGAAHPFFWATYVLIGDGN